MGESEAWAGLLTRSLVDRGIPIAEAQQIAADAAAEAVGAGRLPLELYGPATAYASTLAQAARSSPSGAELGRVRGRVVLRLSQVSKQYRRRTVLSHVDLTLRAGEVAAVVGANGSGKSTLLSICAGSTRATRGTVERTRRVGYAPQQDGVSPWLTAQEHFALFGAAEGMSRGRATAAGIGLSHRLGWNPRPGQIAAHLSGGTQQKLNVVLSELHRPDLILLDEPYQGFDQETYLDFWEQVFAWRDAGAGVLVVTHLLHDLERIDHVVELSPPEET